MELSGSEDAWPAATRGRSPGPRVTPPMTAHRFFVPDATATHQRLRLPDDEAAHLSRVLRLRAGASIRVFDGHGHEYAARVESTDRGKVLVRTLEPVATAPEPSVAITLAQSVLKGRAFDTVVRDATMLGVAAIQPLVTARTDAPGDAARADALRTRWHRVAVASAKQSGRAVVPVVRPAISLADHLTACNDERHLMLVEPSAARGAATTGLVSGPPPRTATVTIGPEGGWCDAELERARSCGCDLVTLGRRTLRADAVPVTAVAVLLYVWGDL